jgi:dolichyl-phosphate beta-glucosyltransferase
MKPFLSVIIPAYNESLRLPATLVQVDRIAEAAEYSTEIIVVDDGSKDGTAGIAERFAATVPNLRVIANQENHGKGWVVRQGMLAARGNWRLFMDADNSTSLSEFDRMLPFTKQGFEVLIGSRAVPGARLNPPQPWYRQLLGKAGNLLIQAMLLPGIHDTQCGFKCFSEDAVRRIFSVARIDRWGFDIEALALARYLGFSIQEIPVTWVNNTHSTVHASAYISTLRDVWVIRRNLARGVYTRTEVPHRSL